MPPRPLSEEQRARRRLRMEDNRVRRAISEHLTMLERDPAYPPFDEKATFDRLWVQTAEEKERFAQFEQNGGSLEDFKFATEILPFVSPLQKRIDAAMKKREAAKKKQNRKALRAAAAGARRQRVQPDSPKYTEEQTSDEEEQFEESEAEDDPAAEDHDDDVAADIGTEQKEEDETAGPEQLEVQDEEVRKLRSMRTLIKDVVASEEFKPDSVPPGVYFLIHLANALAPQEQQAHQELFTGLPAHLETKDGQGSSNEDIEMDVGTRENALDQDTDPGRDTSPLGLVPPNTSAHLDTVEFEQQQQRNQLLLTGLPAHLGNEDGEGSSNKTTEKDGGTRENALGQDTDPGRDTSPLGLVPPNTSAHLDTVEFEQQQQRNQLLLTGLPAHLENEDGQGSSNKTTEKDGGTRENAHGQDTDPGRDTSPLGLVPPNTSAHLDTVEFEQESDTNGHEGIGTIPITQSDNESRKRSGEQVQFERVKRPRIPLCPPGRQGFAAFNMNFQDLASPASMELMQLLMSLKLGPFNPLDVTVFDVIRMPLDKSINKYIVLFHLDIRSGFNHSLKKCLCRDLVQQANNSKNSWIGTIPKGDAIAVASLNCLVGEELTKAGTTTNLTSKGLHFINEFGVCKEISLKEMCTNVQYASVTKRAASKILSIARKRLQYITKDHTPKEFWLLDSSLNANQ